MPFDIEMLREHYSTYKQKVKDAKEALGRPMPLAEKIWYTH